MWTPPPTYIIDVPSSSMMVTRDLVAKWFLSSYHALDLLSDSYSNCFMEWSPPPRSNLYIQAYVYPSSKSIWLACNHARKISFSLDNIKRIWSPTGYYYDFTTPIFIIYIYIMFVINDGTINETTFRIRQEKRIDGCKVTMMNSKRTLKSIVRQTSK